MEYGRKGGDGTNTGKVAVTYLVTLPDNTTKVKKRIFNPPADPVGFSSMHGGKWYLNTVADRKDPRFTNPRHVMCPAERI